MRKKARKPSRLARELKEMGDALHRLGALSDDEHAKITMRHTASARAMALVGSSEAQTQHGLVSRTRCCVGSSLTLDPTYAIDQAEAVSSLALMGTGCAAKAGISVAGKNRKRIERAG